MRQTFLVFVVVSLFSCSGKSDPVDTMKEFMVAVENLDLKKVRKLSTDKYQAVIDRIEKAASAMSEAERAKRIARAKEFKFEYTVSAKTDSTATVTVGSQLEQQDFSVEFYLKKQGNKWLVDSDDDSTH